MTNSRFIGRVALAVVLATVVSLPAFAQTTKPNKGGPSSPGGQPVKSHPGPGHGPQAGGNLPVGTRTTGTWLDDASVLDPGSSWLALSWDDWRSPSGSQKFLPTTNLAIGVTDRVQAQAIIPYQYGGASQYSASGIGDVYAGAKIVLTPASAPVALAVAPTAEILSSQFVATGESRLHWVLPVSVEFGGDQVRVYGSAGYFTRGAAFVGAGISGQVNERVSLVATLSRTSPVGTQVLLDGTPAIAQTDVGGGAYVTLTDRVAVFGNVGRTISQLQADSTKSLVSVGVAIGLRKGRGEIAQKK